jgi:hypothetical protein
MTSETKEKEPKCPYCGWTRHIGDCPKPWETEGE